MKTVTIRELRANLRRLLEYVRRGGAIRITSRGVPIADLTPCGATSSDRPQTEGEDSLKALERDGIVQIGTGKLPPGFHRRQLPRPKASVLQALLTERRRGR